MNYDPQQFPGPPSQVRISVHGYLVPTTVYADALCTQAHAHPVVIGPDGKMPPIFLEAHVAQLYDLTIEDRNGTILTKITQLAPAEVVRRIADEFYGPTKSEQGAHLTAQHIADYAYPPGDRRRYTEAGWAIWQKLLSN